MLLSFPKKLKIGSPPKRKPASAADDTLLHRGLKCKTIAIGPRQTHDEPFHGGYTKS